MRSVLRVLTTHRKQLDRTLAGFAKQPNVAAYILVGLGCETGQAIHLIEGERLLQLNGSQKRPLVLTVHDLAFLKDPTHFTGRRDRDRV